MSQVHPALGPTFLGIGGKKCASTWLSECLRGHPQVFMASPKELHFFENPENFAKGLDWYLEHFRGGDTYLARGEMTATYLTLTPDPGKVRELLGAGLCFVVSLRDPVDRFISEYMHEIRTGLLPLNSHRRLDTRTLRDTIEQVPTMLENGFYGRHLQRYLEVFSASAFHVIDKAEIDSNPAGCVRDLYEFLGVDASFQPPVSSKRVSRGIVPRVVALEKLRHFIFRFAKRASPRFIDLVRRLRLAELYRNLNDAGGKNAIEVTPDAHAALVALYSSDYTLLCELLRREFPSWSTARR